MALHFETMTHFAKPFVLFGNHSINYTDILQKTNNLKHIIY